MKGFWALVTGGAGVLVLLLVLRPIVDQRDCPNFGAAGNASAFPDAAWDLRFPLVLLVWVALVIVEQVLPPRNAGRALAAISLVLVASCCLGASLGTVCR
ncbi:hypothetical protein AB0M02_32780 [Actinoplanes sp. NPDC051861]|uniref:hypothetical protein n=1 Tax=Actinoplanes sp. NPDC051861 TaxID=3155170 RepID=UPI00341C3D82